uniref:Uncharacterized protein n=1 Tax=Panagrolaimus davidi TaxID=227884 RepID=A0A914QHU4_9BILA
MFSNSIRHSSEHELLASRIPAKLERTDSQLTNTSTKSQSSTHSYPAMAEEFDSLEDLPKKCGKSKKTLGDIGKTKSAGDLLKNTKKPANLIRTFQQLNIMRLPSVDSVTSDHTKSLTKLNQMVNDPFFDDLSVSRQKAYEMK